jgi:hypothetical protein
MNGDYRAQTGDMKILLLNKGKCIRIARGNRNKIISLLASRREVINY